MDDFQKEEVQRIIEETTHYDFPFLASREKTVSYTHLTLPTNSLV